jgi:O-antigen ligase/tetratricopeptide (TPR) repeat protein
MARTTDDVEGRGRDAGTPGCPKGVRVIRAGIEALVLLMVCLAPWAYGAVHPGFEFLLYVGLGGLLALWGARLLLEGQLTWKKCPVALCLAALFLSGIWQLTPLPRSLLAVVSPATARWYGELLPSQPEVLPLVETSDGSPSPAGSTISLYPGATQKEVLRLLAVFLLFAVVRNNVASADGLRRLGILAVVNGALLSQFALVQFFTSGPGKLYWSFPAEGGVFGPFICRNHFPYYVNMCVGLGVGLLAGRGLRSGGRGPDWHLGETDRTEPSEVAGGPFARVRLQSVLGFLQDPPALWLCVALALMLSSDATSLSRGGLLALMGGLVVCLLVRLTSVPRPLRLAPALLVAAVAAALVGWFGFARIATRLTTLWGGKALEENRLPVWARVLPSVREFPLWGTGYGTFPYVDVLHHTSASEEDELWDHAHNDYLELLIEGGVLGLGLGLLAVVLVFRLGYRAVRLHAGHQAGALALGGLFGFTTFVVHSFVDFGAHLPAITVLATVLCAHLCALGSAEEGLSRRASPAPEGGEEAGHYRVRLGGAAPVLAGVAGLALGLLLCVRGWGHHRADRLQLAALTRGDSESIAGRERRIAYLTAAVAEAPTNALLHGELGQSYFELFEERAEGLWRSVRAAEVAEAVLVWAGPGLHAGSAHPALAAAPSLALTSMAPAAQARLQQERLARDYLAAGLRHFVQARRLCPLLSGPHLVIALHVDDQEGEDARGASRRRAKLVEPANPNVWHLCGAQELRDGRPEQAWESWRRCLELSQRYLPAILHSSSQLLGPRELVEKVLPARPDVLVAAATQLYPAAEAAAERRPFLEEALRLLEARRGLATGADLRLKAQTHKSLGQPAEALAAYQELLAREPRQAEWRYELAQLLYEQGRLQEARRELHVVLAQQPAHAAARALLSVVIRELARSG